MSNAIAFFPWIYIEGPLTIGSLRLLPYVHKKLPGDLPNVSQLDIDGVFGAYSNRPSSPVKRGAILELGDWCSGMDMTPDILGGLFRAKEILAIAALSKRELFRQHFGYTNSHSYALVVQRYLPGETGKFAFTTRRRDGGTSQFWGSSGFAFHRPNHVDSSWKLDVDDELVTALLELPPTESGIYEAIVEFNAANTDSPDVPLHVEVVMCKSAFEWLLEINESRGAFMKALAKLLPVEDAEPGNGPLTAKWLDRWNPKDGRVLMAWAQEFCAVRGSAAHGKERPNSFIWENAQHLAFASILFPLLLKATLAVKGFMKLSEYDREHLRHVEDYLRYDPFDAALDQDLQHVWTKVDSEVRMSVWTRRPFG